MKTNSKNLAMLHVAVMLFGLSGVLGKFVDLPAVMVTFGRVVFSAGLLFAILKVKKEKLTLNLKRDYIIVAIAGAVMAIHWTTFFQSIQSSTVAIGAITFSTFPLFLTCLEPIIFREKISKRNMVYAIILLIGVGITIPDFSISNSYTQGIIWGMISSFTYAILVLFNRYLASRYDGMKICFYEQGTTAILLLPASFFIAVEWNASNVFGVVCLGLLCTAFAYSLYVSAQKSVKAQTAGLISGMETVYGIVYALIFLREIPTTRELLGGVIILTVALISGLEKKE